MRSRAFILGPVAVILLMAGSSIVLARVTGDPRGSSGAPPFPGISADRTCNDAGCHSGNITNNGQGQIQILGLPAVFNPGESYEITLELGSTATQGNPNRRWGFVITAIDLETGTSANAGTWSFPPADMRKFTVPTKMRDYITHRQPGVQQGQASPGVFDLTWTAPDTGGVVVGFFFSGNAANGNGTSTGDFIYTGVDTSRGPGTAVEPTTWSSIKRARSKP